MIDVFVKNVTSVLLIGWQVGGGGCSGGAGARVAPLCWQPSGYNEPPGNHRQMLFPHCTLSLPSESIMASADRYCCSVQFFLNR